MITIAGGVVIEGVREILEKVDLVREILFIIHSCSKKEYVSNV